MSTIVAVISDLHTGSTTAIAPPKFEVHADRDHSNEVNITEANRYQRLLYGWWSDYWAYVTQLAGVRGKTRKRRLVVLILGDCVDGLHHRSPQVMNEPSDQIKAAFDLLRPVVELADGGMWITYGTGAHNGGCAEHEVTLARMLGERVHHGWEFALDVDGVTFDLAHHGRAGRRDWTSAAAGLAAEVATDYISDGKLPPRYVLRGHNHLIDDSGSKLPYTRAISLPAWQLRTAYGHQVAANRKRSDIGGLIVDTAYPEYPNLTRMRYKLPGGAITVEKV